MKPFNPFGRAIHDRFNETPRAHGSNRVTRWRAGMGVRAAVRAALLSGMLMAGVLLVGPLATTADAGLRSQPHLAAVLSVPTVRRSISPGVTIVDLRTEAAHAPLGIDVRQPRLTWRLAADRRGVRQTAYRVIVGTSRAAVADGRGSVWDSGQVRSSATSAVFAGEGLRSRTRYFWSVRALDERGRRISPSPVGTFETAFMKASDWSARWIGGPDVSPAPSPSCSAQGEEIREESCTAPSPVLRTEFTVNEPIRSARLYASGLGWSVYHLNGRRTSDAVLDPGFTEYDDRFFYVTHDVTDLLRRGRNALAVELGRGIYGQQSFNFAGYNAAEWHSDPEVRLELHLTMRDGTTRLIRSGPGWRATDGPSRFDDYMRGQEYDARRAAALTGWKLAAYDDTAWKPVRLTQGPAGVPVAQGAEPIRPQQRLPFKSIKATGPGRYLFDLGHNVAGTVRLDADIPAGRTIELRYGEKLRADGTIDTEMLPGVSGLGELQVDRYTGRRGPDRWRPEFSYKGFQFVQVTGLATRPPLGMLTAEVWHNDVRSAGSWRSSSGLANRIVRNTKRAVLNNLFWQPTDTPIYEKTGYTGDGQLMAAANSYMFDMQRFYTKWARDIEQAQDPGEGELLGIIAPTSRSDDFIDKDWPGPSPGWDISLFSVPDVLHTFHGDSRPMVQMLPEMKKYAGWAAPYAAGGVIVGQCVTPTGFNPCTNGLGDWLTIPGQYYGVSLDSTAHYHEMQRLLMKAARAAGDRETAETAAAEGGRVRDAFNAVFWDPVAGVYRNDPAQVGTTQHQQAIALGLGLVPGERVASVGKWLADDVRARGNHLDVGIMGNRFLWPSLTRTGHLREAWAATMSKTYPSYGYWIDELGFTALGENWEANTRSHSHMMFGTIVQWFYEDIAGYRPVTPGFRRIEFRPEIPAGLGSVSASSATVAGRVATTWRKTEYGLVLEVTVPPNSTGVVHIPAGSSRLVREVAGGADVLAERALGVRLLGQRGDRVLFEVGSGTYRFVVR